MKMTMRRFTLDTKLKIIAEQNVNNYSTTKFVLGIAYSYINLINGRNILLFIILKKQLRSMNNGRIPLYLEHEECLLNYIHEKRGARMFVSVRSVTLKLRELSDLANSKSFSSCRRWLYRFLGRNHLSIRNVTKQTTSLMMRNCEGSIFLWKR
jgi:hypothetical protein